MLSRWIYIGKMLLIALLVMSCTSCARWREAKAVIAEADSLLVYGNIIEDTAVLAATINTFSGPMGYVFARNDLANAYYHMARNFYHAHDYATAADYYILCDRLNPTDPMYKGRVNSCMGFLCKQDSCFEEALEFYQRSSCAFKESGNEWYYAHNLVNVAEQYVNLREYAKADSVLDIANDYDIDSAYYARIVDVRALALFNQQLYDSALVCLLSIKDYPRPIEAKCYSYMKIMQCYARMDSLEQVVPLAKYLLCNSTNAIHRSNAYFYLIKDAEVRMQTAEVAMYSYLREDEDRLVQHLSEDYAQASFKLCAYLTNPYPFRRIVCYVFFTCIILLFVIGIFSWWLYRKLYQTMEKQTDMLQEYENQHLDRCEAFKNRVYNHSVCFMDAKIWKDDVRLRKEANLHIGDIFTRFEEIHHFNDREIKICLMILLEYSREQMAAILYVQPNTISKAKIKIAKDLGTTTAQLYDFLIDFLAI